MPLGGSYEIPLAFHTICTIPTDENFPVHWPTSVTDDNTIMSCILYIYKSEHFSLQYGYPRGQQCIWDEKAY